MDEQYLDRNRIRPVDKQGAKSQFGLQSLEGCGLAFYGDGIRGTITPDAGQRLRDIAARYSNGLVVNLGTWEGMSVAYMYETCRDNGTKIVAVDRYYDPVFEANLRYYWGNEDTGTVDYYTMESTDAAATFEDRSVNMLFYDVGHTYKTVIADMQAWITKVKNVGVVCGMGYDDNHKGIVKALNECFGESFIESADSFWCVHLRNLPIRAVRVHVASLAADETAVADAAPVYPEEEEAEVFVDQEPSDDWADQVVEAPSEDEAPVEDEAPAEEVVSDEEAPVEDEAASEESVSEEEAPVEDETVTDEYAQETYEEVPVEDEITTEEYTQETYEEAPADDDWSDEETTDEEWSEDQSADETTEETTDEEWSEDQSADETTEESTDEVPEE